MVGMNRWRRKLRSLYSLDEPDVEKEPSLSSAPHSPLTPEPGPSDGGGANAVTTNSPVNKRRVFSGRKWLPPPLRKLSGGKVEKNAIPDRPPLKKTPSDKRFKSPVNEMGNKQGQPAAPGTGIGTGVEEEAVRDQNGEEGEEEVELPPPMKPITEPILVPPDDTQGQRSSNMSLEGATSADLAEIEQIVKERMEQHSEKQSKLSVSDVAESEESAVQKREYVIRELVETERDYVRDLRLVAEGYMALMRDPDCDIPMPEDLRGGKDKMVFGNLEAIYEWHRDFFLKALERCISHPEELGPLFKRYERKLLMYVVYCQNKPVSEYIVSEYIDTYFEELRQKLGHKLQLCDLLIKPVQRIMKYQLLLRDLYKYTERAHLSAEVEALRQATHVMHVVPKAANDMMDVGRLQGFDGKITAQGKLLLHGPLVCSEGTSGINFKGKELQVFLFEQNIIFSEAVGKKTQFTNPVYIYKNHIQVNKMSLEERVSTMSEEKEKEKEKERERDSSSSVELFCVRSTDPRKPSLAYVCQAATGDLRAEWLQNLRTILQTQRDFLKAIQSPIAYQKELTKDPFSLSVSLRPPSPPLHEQCTVIVSEPLSGKTKHQSNFLEGFRNTLRRAKSETPEVENSTSLARRWSDAHPTQSSHYEIVPEEQENENDLASGGPNIHLFSNESVLVEAGEGSVECCDHETGQWGLVNAQESPVGHIVSGLTAGHTYSFRIQGGPQSLSVTLPHESRWQQEQFERRYQELHWIGRGRSGLVRAARDKGTGQMVALKQVERRRIPQCVTRAEYSLLASLNHRNVVRSLAMFENAPSPGTDTIVMELVSGEELFIHVCSQTTVRESQVRSLTEQLLSALDCLHQQQITHCDIKPENLLVEEQNGALHLKIVDFGSACITPVTTPIQEFSFDLEFAAPELLLEPPVASPSVDIWSTAVFVYVFLSGVSPFLDDSPEETRAHILSGDFSFPPEFFPPETGAAQNFVCQILVPNSSLRPKAQAVLSSVWLTNPLTDYEITTARLAAFVQRRHPHTVSHPP